MSYDQNVDLEGSVALEELPLDIVPIKAVDTKPTTANLPAVITAVAAETVGDSLNDEDLESLQADLDADDKKPSQASSTVPSIGKFDYTVLPHAAAKEAQAAATRIHDRLTTSIVDVGADLLKIKPLLGHGNFTPWIKAEFGWSERSAQNYMNAAELIAKNATVAVLPPTSIYRLGAKNVPESALKGVTALINAGWPPSDDDLVDMIKEAKAAERLVKAAERETKKPASATAKAVTPATVATAKPVELNAQQRKADKAKEQKQAGIDALDMLRKSLGVTFDDFRSLYVKSNGQFDVLIRKP